MAQLFGKAVIRIGGKTVTSERGAKLNRGGINRNPVPEAGGYSETPVMPELTCQIHLSNNGITLKEIEKYQGTVAYAKDVGGTDLLMDAVLAEPLVVTDGDPGQVDVKWIGTEVKEA